MAVGATLMLCGAAVFLARAVPLLPGDATLLAGAHIGTATLGLALGVLGVFVATRRSVESPGAVIGAGAAIIVVGCVMHALYGYTWPESAQAIGSDDAYISFRYAKNFADGLGLVYNAGERVEGYTNLLYVLLIAPIFMINGALVYGYTVALNILCLIAAAAIFYWFIAQRLSGLVAAAGTILFAAQPILWLWAGSGTEAPLILLLQLAVWALAVRYRETSERRLLWLLAFTCALCALVRADGFITPLVAVLYLACQQRFKAAASIAFVTASVVAALTLWRLQYYGFPLPNTFYAKVHGDLLLRGWMGVRKLLLVIREPDVGFFVVVSMVVPAANLQRVLKTRALRALTFPTIFTAIWLGYYLYIGGDHYRERFLIALIPVGIYALLGLSRAAVWRALPAALIGSLFIVSLSPFAGDRRFAYAGPKYDIWLTLGAYLGEHHSGAYLATTAAGKLPFSSGLKTLDMLGLNDLFIGHSAGHLSWTSEPGHEKYQPEYVLAQSPDLIATWLVGQDFDLDVGISEAQYRRAGYVLVYLVNSNLAPRTDNILDVTDRDRDYVQAMRKHGYSFGVVAKRR